MTPFDLAHTPLEGNCLIEAGAGTGKTYAIAGIYLRLILEAGLAVDQILVVTFTTAATAELKDRIRKRLTSAQNAFQRGDSQDLLERTLLSRSAKRVEDLRKLKNALADFDRAAVYTIHGFCQRILYDHAFETGSLFDVELISDPSELIRETAEDFWRKAFFDAPPEWIIFAQAALKNPEALAALFRNKRNPGLNVIPREAPPDITKPLERYRKSMNRLRELWTDQQEEIRERLLDSALKGNIYGSLPTAKKSGTRENKIDGLMLEMGKFLDGRLSGFPLFDRFTLFTDSKIKASTKKGADPPLHLFFSACEELSVQAGILYIIMEQRLVDLKQRFLYEAERSVGQKKKQNQVQFFDDLLSNVRSALAENNRFGLKQNIRDRFHAALVDEFQDTDAVQYDIFSRLFGASDRLLFMIGDPKQAIYGFRGADLFSYIDAANQADRRYTLLTNWRSASGLVHAANTVFNSAEKPFLLSEIDFLPAMPSPEPPPDPEESPLVLWFLPGTHDDGSDHAHSRDTATNRICEAVANEIDSLIRRQAGKERKTYPRDIAVLTRTHDQAQRIRDTLSRSGIPAVLYDAGGVFQTYDAVELEFFLHGVAEPGNDRTVRAALATSLIGATAADLDFDEALPSWWEERVSRFVFYREVWVEQGFMPMFRQAMDNEGIALRILRKADGERRLTNLQHLAELLHAEWSFRRPGVSGLMRWFTDQRLNAGVPGDEQLVRLESDDAAVAVVTMHRSKGLEYPVVFCPFLWGGSELRRGELPVFHDPDDDYQAVMDLGSSTVDRSRILAENELLAENLRLTYVAVTRASRQCYLAWGRINGGETSALAYLLHLSNRLSRSETESIPAQMKTRFRELSSSDLQRDLETLADASKGTIAILPLPEACLESDKPSPPPKTLSLQANKRSRDFGPRWQIASYSVLWAHKGGGIAPEIDRDATQAFRPPAVLPIESDPDKTSVDIVEMAGFPAGAHAGIFFHELFERIDYKDKNHESVTKTVADSLRRHGFDASWLGPVVQMIHNTLSTRLGADEDAFCLSGIGKMDRLNELGFYYPLNPLNHNELRNIYAANPDFPASEILDRRFNGRGFTLAGGFMKGFIDLVFRKSGRFYLVDWKSNYLGRTYSDYGRLALEKIMGEAGYTLQYHLYTVALNRWLGMHVPDYRYEKHFGGVFYLFFRGMHPRFGGEYGVFFDRPAPRLVQALDTLLVADMVPAGVAESG